MSTFEEADFAFRRSMQSLLSRTRSEAQHRIVQHNLNQMSLALKDFESVYESVMQTHELAYQSRLSRLRFSANLACAGFFR